MHNVVFLFHICPTELRVNHGTALLQSSDRAEVVLGWCVCVFVYRDRMQLSPAQPEGENNSLLSTDFVLSKMAKSCPVVGCTHNRVKNPELSFYKLPNRKTEPLRRQKWITLQAMCSTLEETDLTWGARTAWSSKTRHKTGQAASHRKHIKVKTEQLFNWKDIKITD